MFYSKKSNSSWLLMSSAVVSGFLLGYGYKRYGKEIKNQFEKYTHKHSASDDLMSSPDSEI
ncbi:hypothetical protein LPY66_09700 [Dehalobacter sp. DCM]|uniref:hypothetical protein n=1 Tax=Dehalobacter sp. DCM TaxID=2907827 RepID=UPI003081B0F7|nr:hypothetical protein LPY66_09700 [Dehalobacter sp. DCM]